MAQSPVTDNNSVQPTFQHNANELVAVKQKKRTPKGTNIVVLKKSNVSTRDEEVYMPNTIEMAQLKKPEKGQFKTNVQIATKMTEMDIKRILVENFPFLEHLRFWCAAAVDNRTRLDFHGERRIWDGRFLKQTIKGNSTLYIFTDEDPKVSEQSTLKRSHDQVTTLENDRFDQASKKICTVAADENVPKHTRHSAYPGSEKIDLNPCTSAQSLLQISGLQDTPFDQSFEDEVSGQEQFPTVIDNSSQTDQIGWCLGTSAHSSHQTEEQSYIDHAITFASTVQMPELDIDLFYEILRESGQGSSGSDRELTSSGISDDDGLDSIEQDRNLRTWEEEQRYTLEIDPKQVSMKGKTHCELAVIPMFPVVPLLTAEVLSVEFVLLQTVQAKRCGEFYYVKTPPAQEPGWYTVILRSCNGEKLGTTQIEYVDEEEEFLRQLLEDPKKQQLFIVKLLSHIRGKSETSSGEKQNSGNLGSTQAVGSTHALLAEVLQLLVYAAVKVMFNWSPGKEIVDSHEESAALPGFIARNHGHENTAHYLEDIITRISKQMTAKGSQTIDRSTLMAAAEAAQEQHGLGVASGEENHQPESDENSDYYGDVESLSSDSSEPTSDSEDDFSEMFSKVSVKEDEIQLEEDALEKNKGENTVQASFGSSFEPQVSEKDQIGWCLGTSAHNSHQTEERSNIDRAITTFMADPLPELDEDVLFQIPGESGQGSSSSDRELTTSGISDDNGLDSSEQDHNLRTREEEQRYILEIDPKKVSVKGAGSFYDLTAIPMLPVVPLLTAEMLPVKAKRCGEFYYVKPPPGQEPGWYTVILSSHNGEKWTTRLTTRLQDQPRQWDPSMHYQSRYCKVWFMPK